MSILKKTASTPGRVVLGLCALLGLAGCGQQETSYTAEYERQAEGVRAATLDAAGADALAQGFVTTFARLGQPDFMTAADRLFSPDLVYVNDVLSHYHRFDAVRAHLAEMSGAVSDARVDKVASWQQGDSVYVHWRMEYTLHVQGSSRRMASHGISQLKADAAGRIVFQQDFWDSNNGLYRQLPVAGWLYRWLLPFKGQ